MSTPESGPIPVPVARDSAEAEHENHRYLGHELPWYIHLLWLSFWIVALVYIFRYLLPVIQGELRSPP